MITLNITFAIIYILFWIRYVVIFKKSKRKTFCILDYGFGQYFISAIGIPHFCYWIINLSLKYLP